jgi:hypothetical protein
LRCSTAAFALLGGVLELDALVVAVLDDGGQREGQKPSWKRHNVVHSQHDPVEQDFHSFADILAWQGREKESG